MNMSLDQYYGMYGSRMPGVTPYGFIYPPFAKHPVTGQQLLSGDPTVDDLINSARKVDEVLGFAHPPGGNEHGGGSGELAGMPSGGMYGNPNITREGNMLREEKTFMDFVFG